MPRFRTSTELILMGSTVLSSWVLGEVWEGGGVADGGVIVRVAPVGPDKMLPLSDSRRTLDWPLTVTVACP
jgi:hypothetical protein